MQSLFSSRFFHTGRPDMPRMRRAAASQRHAGDTGWRVYYAEVRAVYDSPRPGQRHRHALVSCARLRVGVFMGKKYFTFFFTFCRQPKNVVWKIHLDTRTEKTTIDQLLIRLIDWLIDCSLYCSIDLLLIRLIDWLIDVFFVDWLFGWLLDWFLLFDWLIDCFGFKFRFSVNVFTCVLWILSLLSLLCSFPLRFRYAVIAAGCAECPRLVCEREECGTAFCYHCAGVWHPVRYYALSR